MRKNGEMSLERISRKTVQISNSVPCKVLVIGLFCGVCIASSISAVLTNAHKAALVYSSSHDAISKNSRLFYPENNTNGCPIVIQQKLQVVKKVSPSDKDQRIMNLYNAWSSSLNGETLDSSLPHPPHVEDCKLNIEINTRHDKWTEDGSFPNWIFWKGYLGTESIEDLSTKMPEQGDLGNNPPWIEGSDEENYPLTRRVQRDIWMHQHPRDCKNPNLTFLIADWTSLRGLGFGAQLASMAGLLGIAMQEKRILVTNYFNRADHSGCKGKNRSQWSCYFFSETSMECKDRAFELMRKQDVLMNGLVKLNGNYTSKEIWIGSTPRLWGKPWNNLQPTTEIDGKLLTKHRKMNIKWWRAQAVRYLMRYKTNYTCQLLNKARNEAFGIQAAKIVTENLSAQLPKVINNTSEIESEMERLVWSRYKPWMPRPLLSVHVRIGDKAGEMKIFEFEKYMELANRIREHFPNLKNIWLSTEMQEVIDKTMLYTNWTFYYTNVARQAGNTSMATYEGSLGRELSTNYPLVNFLLASEADFFVGALGSTWCYLIDGMRNTGGKVMAGYLSVNKDRFW